MREADDALRAAEERIFAAIRARDIASLERELTEDFVHSSPGSPDQGRDAFLRAIDGSPYRILEIQGEDLRARVLGEVAILSGIQRARVVLPDGKVVVAATAFVDCFVASDARWRLRHAVSFELPAATEVG
jgi:ketosteroid isomerase-like protein